MLEVLLEPRGSGLCRIFWKVVVLFRSFRVLGLSNSCFKGILPGDVRQWGMFSLLDSPRSKGAVRLLMNGFRLFGLLVLVMEESGVLESEERSREEWGEGEES